VTGGDPRLGRALTALSVTETTSWGTLYYSLPAMLVPLSRSTGWPDSVIMGAFAALTRWYGPRRVPALTTLSLVAGLASTVFAPLTALLTIHLGWRLTDVVLAAVLGW
jgi:hypothetical protein